MQSSHSPNRPLEIFFQPPITTTILTLIIIFMTMTTNPQRHPKNLHEFHRHGEDFAIIGIHAFAKTRGRGRFGPDILASGDRRGRLKMRVKGLIKRYLFGIVYAVPDCEGFFEIWVVLA